jgi:cation-transporting ATPase I
VILQPAALRRLDRIKTVVLDADVLITGRFVLGAITPAPGANPREIAGQLHALFRAEAPFGVRTDGPWQVGPLDAQPAWLLDTGREQAATAAAGLIGLVHLGGLVAVAAVVPEPIESLEAMVATCRRAGCRLVIAGEPGSVGTAFADAVRPGGAGLAETVRDLQRDGRGVLLLSSHGAALAHADLGLGVADQDGRPAWRADVLIGSDLTIAALLIEASAFAARASGRAAVLAQAAAAIGGMAAATAGSPAAAINRGLLISNTAAGLSLAQGVWAARELLRRPLDPPTSRVPWHAMPVDAVLERLRTRPEGLISAEVRQRGGGRSGVAFASGSLLSAIVEELANPLTPILGAGAALAAAVGSMVDAALVAGVTLAGAVIGGVQRQGTDNALRDLFAESAVTARIRRGGREALVTADALVPGDIVRLASGDVVPADCRVIDARSLEADESSLTGEAFPAVKSADPVIAEAVADRSSMLHEGTTVAAGRAVVVVVATGAATEAGRSMAATRIGAGAGGVEARLARITGITLPATLGSAGAVLAAGLAWGRSLRATATSAVGLAVAAVPEGLPFLVNGAQLAAARRLSDLGALVRNPRTIEALGRVDVLCFDKTGTLTEGKIRLGAVALPGGKPVPLRALQEAGRTVLAAAIRATPQPPPGEHLAHLTDRAVVDGADAIDVTATDIPGWRRQESLPFEPSRGYHATMGSVRGAATVSVKGAPEIVLPRCVRVRARDTTVRLRERDRRRLLAQAEELALSGYRVLTVAERVLPPPSGALRDEEVAGLTLLGFLALTDPVRSAAQASIEALRAAGVQIVMITGDHAQTAAAIARDLDLLDGGQLVSGAELDSLDDAALDAVLPSVCVVARGTPAHKVRVVQAFQRLHRTVAMTGDGANDAPAIRLADVGIALGLRGTPAARAAADVVVTDDRLETIISALVEGRAMWGSVRKALGILVGGNLGEIAFTVLGALATGRSPLSARQFLLVNMLTDLAPALALALRPPRAESTAALLTEGPEASLGAALTRDVGVRAVGTATGAVTGWLVASALGLGPAAPTVALAALVGSQLAQTVVAGGRTTGVLASSLGSVAALSFVIQHPTLSAFFGCTPLGWSGWASAATSAVIGTSAAAALPRLLRALPVVETAPVAASDSAEPSPSPALSVAA